MRRGRAQPWGAGGRRAPGLPHRRAPCSRVHADNVTTATATSRASQDNLLRSSSARTAPPPLVLTDHTAAGPERKPDTVPAPSLIKNSASVQETALPGPMGRPGPPGPADCNAQLPASSLSLSVAVTARRVPGARPWMELGARALCSVPEHAVGGLAGLGHVAALVLLLGLGQLLRCGDGASGEAAMTEGAAVSSDGRAAQRSGRRRPPLPQADPQTLRAGSRARPCPQPACPPRAPRAVPCRGHRPPACRATARRVTRQSRERSWLKR